MKEVPIAPGMRVTWNASGESLFGKTTWTALVVGVEGKTAHLLWESDQETFTSVSCLQRVPEIVREGR